MFVNFNLLIFISFLILLFLIIFICKQYKPFKCKIENLILLVKFLLKRTRAQCESLKPFFNLSVTTGLLNHLSKTFREKVNGAHMCSECSKGLRKRIPNVLCTFWVHLTYGLDWAEHFQIFPGRSGWNLCNTRSKCMQLTRSSPQY